ncbi:MAG: AraC family transcriptional regulator [Shinella sp.]|uniref:helix-turn-helix domain-containing protein n=1 Tax=Shinella sp. TaxID=1870904 RepID=UPI003C73EF59
MNRLIPFEELPDWVPGRLLLASDGLGWRHVQLRSYHYEGQDVIVPAMRDFMLVGYRAGTTPMRRRFEGRWTNETLGPGATSLLTRAQRANWTWHQPIDVTHLYLDGGFASEVASEVMDCHVKDVTLADVLRTEDPVVTYAMEMISAEARDRGLGGALYVESLARALVVHLLRRYASVHSRDPVLPGTLSPRQQRLIADYIEAHLAEPLDLKGMGAVLGLSPCLFARQFRSSFGKPPYAWVIAARIKRAQFLLARSQMPIKAIAAECGFSDQAHLTRVFSLACKQTPAAFRRRAS